MTYEEYEEKEQEIKRKTHLEYLQVSEEIKEALCRVERKAKKSNKKREPDDIER